MFSTNSAARRRHPKSGPPSLQVISKREGKKPRHPSWLWGLVLLIAGVALVHYLYNEEKELPPGIIQTPEGDLVLSPERQAKLDRELQEIDNAIQYALVAIVDGLYPCLSCPSGQKTIFLKKGNVWKYGITRKGEAERYPGGNYGADALLFLPQFTGTYSECLKMEKTMIYNYPFLPEARDREIVLLRPPGNRYDS
ncbi:hypothetical protein [Phaeodactylibacter xiamenensis]|uniref:hypothetical protein n=1 Tax=Phaeodactylibacter xiamenensis TaxID=1524460 RepID=UPI003CCBBA0D